MSPRIARVRLLAFDGLDWPLVQRCVDGGLMPTLDRLLNSGASGALREPMPRAAASRWSTVATGLEAQWHGVLADLEPGPGGFSGSAVGRSALRAPPCWELAAGADPAIAPAVLNWPATHPAAAAGPGRGVLIAPGAQSTRGAMAEAWGLHPDAVWPPAERAAVHAHRVHPDDLDEAVLADLLHGADPRERKPLARATRAHLAELATLQALAVRLAATPGSRLAALRFDTLDDVAASVAQALRPAADGSVLTQPWQVLAGWMRFIDMLLAQHLATLAADDALLLVSSGALPAALQAARRGAVPEQQAGFVLLHGPGVRPDSLIEGAQAVDIAPTVLGWLGLPPPPGCTGRALADLSGCNGRALADLSGSIGRAPATLSGGTGKALADAPGGADRTLPSAVGTAGSPDPAPSTLHPLRPLTPADLHGDAPLDADGLAWLAAQGVAPPPLDPLRALSRQVRAGQLLGLAEALLDGGRDSDAAAATDALRGAIALAGSPTAPVAAQATLLLARHWLERGELASAEALADQAAPLLAGAPDWQDLVAGMRAQARGDWPQAGQCFARLAAQRSALVNAPAWQARALIGQQRWDEAEALLQTALGWPVERAAARGQLGDLLLQRGRPAEAAQAYASAVAEQPASPRWHGLRARALALAGDTEAAIAAYWRLLQLAPEQTQARAELVRLQRGQLPGR